MHKETRVLEGGVLLVVEDARQEWVLRIGRVELRPLGMGKEASRSVSRGEITMKQRLSFKNLPKIQAKRFKKLRL